MHGAGQQERNEDVQDGADDERAENPDRHVALGILGFLRGGGDGVKADVGEKDDAGGSNHSSPAIGRRHERMQVGDGLRLMMEEISGGHGDEGYNGEELDEDDGGVEVRRFLDANHKNGGDDEDGEKGEQIEARRGVRQRGKVNSLARQGDGRNPAMIQEHPDRARGIADLRREIDAVILEEGDQGAAPTGGHGCGSEGILEDQVPADDPGEDFAQGCVSVGVGRAGDGNQRSEFGITQAGKGTGDAGKNVGDDDGRSGVTRRSRTGEDEDSGANDGTHAQHDEVDGAKDTLEAVLARLTGLGEQHVQWFG